MPSGAQTSNSWRPRLAAYIAVSARASSRDRSRPWSGQTAMPMLASTCSGIPSRTKASRRAVPEAGRDLLRAHRVGVGQQDGELVTAHPGEQVAVLQGALQAGADQAQQVVADTVPEAVVDLLEPVQVDHEDGARPATVAVDGGLQLLDEAAAVGQPGQRILVGLGGQLREAQLLDRPQLGVLDHEGALEGHLAHGLAHRRGPVPGLADRRR